MLIIFAGSQGHFHGIKQFVGKLRLNDELSYASHIGMPDEQLKIITYYQINAPPAFLGYEFLHFTSTKKIIQLKSEMIYYHQRKQSLIGAVR